MTQECNHTHTQKNSSHHHCFQASKEKLLPSLKFKQQQPCDEYCGLQLQVLFNEQRFYQKGRKKRRIWTFHVWAESKWLLWFTFCPLKACEKNKLCGPNCQRWTDPVEFKLPFDWQRPENADRLADAGRLGNNTWVIAFSAACTLS